MVDLNESMDVDMAGRDNFDDVPIIFQSSLISEISETLASESIFNESTSETNNVNEVNDTQLIASDDTVVSCESNFFEIF